MPFLTTRCALVDANRITNAAVSALGNKLQVLQESADKLGDTVLGFLASFVRQLI